MATIAHNDPSGFKSLVRSASARLSGLLGARRVQQPPRPQSGDTARDAQERLVEAKRKNTGMAMQTLRSSLKAGKLTQEEYLVRVAQLSAIHHG